jgi:hypothetical protein
MELLLRFPDLQLDPVASPESVYCFYGKVGKTLRDPVASPQSVNCFYGKVGKTLRSHKNHFGDRGNRTTPA